MGYWAKPPHGQNESVNYFLDTAKESPFAMHDYQIQIRLGMVPGESQNEIKAKLAVKLYGEYDHSDEIILTQWVQFYVVVTVIEIPQLCYWGINCS